MSILDGKKLEESKHPEVIFCVETEEKLKTYEPATGVDCLGWYFWDETWTYAHGPFSTYEETAEYLSNYANGYLSS